MKGESYVPVSTLESSWNEFRHLHRWSGAWWRVAHNTSSTTPPLYRGGWVVVARYYGGTQVASCGYMKEVAPLLYALSATRRAISIPEGYSYNYLIGVPRTRGILALHALCQR